MASPLLVRGGGKNQCQWMYAWQFVGLLCVSVSSLLVSVKVGPLNTVLVQISEGRIFRGCHKFNIFAIIFSRITGFRIGRLCVRTIIKYKFSRT